MRKIAKFSLTMLLAAALLLMTAIPAAGFFVDGVGPFPNLINGTHRWLVNQGFDILDNEQPAVASRFDENARALIWQYVDWPDSNERGDTLANRIMGTWHSHRGEDGLDTLGNAGITANTRFVHWYNIALAYYADGDQEGAFAALGKSIHYLTDMASPPHAGERSFEVLGNCRIFNPFRVAVNAINHPVYEAWVNIVKYRHAVQCGGLYDDAVTYSPEEFGHQTAQYAMQFYPFFGRGFFANSNTRIAAPLHRAQRSVAGILYRFYHDTK